MKIIITGNSSKCGLDKRKSLESLIILPNSGISAEIPKPKKLMDTIEYISPINNEIK